METIDELYKMYGRLNIQAELIQSDIVNIKRRIMEIEFGQKKNVVQQNEKPKIVAGDNKKESQRQENK